MIHAEKNRTTAVSPFALGVATALAMLLAGCTATTDVGWAVSVRVSPSDIVVAPDAPIEVTVVLLNRGPDPVTTDHPNNYCGGAFVVRNALGESVGPRSGFCALVAYPPVRLPAGDSIVLKRSWNGDNLAPGAYTLVGRVGVETGGVESAPITVLIR
jgi:hypothetical protein